MIKYYCPYCDFRTIREWRRKEHEKFHSMNPKLMDIEYLDKLMSPTRFDLMGKYLYVKFKDKKVLTDFYVELYSKHIESMNGYRELPYAKSGISEFLSEFNKLIISMTTEGFKKEHFIPVGHKNNITNGAHRTAISYYYKIKPYVIIDENNKICEYPYKFLVENNLYPPLDQLYADEIALQYIKVNKNLRCMILHPISCEINNKNAGTPYIKLEEYINEYGIIYYKKEIQLNDNGYQNLVKELYRGEKWIGGMFPTGGYEKYKYCVSQNPVTLILIAFNDPEKNIELKEKCRKLFQLEKHSLHTTDAPEDTFRVSSALLNSNSIHFLNNGTNNLSSNTRNVLHTYFNQVNYDEQFCITSSVILEMYGLRNANDLDYLHETDHKLIQDNIGCHCEKWLEYYHVHKHDIIYNPRNHFYFNGHKFATLNVIQMMKEKRGEHKDKNDVQLIKNLSLGKKTEIKYEDGLKKKFRCKICGIECNKLTYINNHILQKHK